MSLIEHINTTGTIDLGENQWTEELKRFTSENNSESEFIGANLPFKTAEAKKTFIMYLYKNIASSNDDLLYYTFWTIRLLLREQIEINLLTTNEFIDAVVKIFGNTRNENVRIEATKCLINTCHHSTALRSHFTSNGLGSIIASDFEALFLQEDEERLSQAFLAGRLLFYCTIDATNARYFVEHYSDLFNRLVRFTHKQLIRFRARPDKIARYELLFCDTLKLSYNIALHHENMIKEASLFCTKELVDLIKDVVNFCHVNPGFYQMAKYALQPIMCTPPFFCAAVFTVKQESISVDPSTADATVPADTDSIYNTIQLIVTKLADPESFTDFVTPVLLGMYNAMKVNANIKSTLYEWIIQNQNWPGKIDVPESIVSTLKYWGNKQEHTEESVEEKETVEEQPKSGDETQEGDVDESDENITQSRVDKLDAHDIHTNLAKAVLVKYMSCYDSNLKNSMNQFLFYLCDDDVDHFAREFGIGNSIGFLAEKGFLGSLMQQQVTSGSTLDEAHAAETEVQDDQDQEASGDVAE